MDIVQEFYDKLSGQYHKLFKDWNAEADEQAEFWGSLFAAEGYDDSAAILDCACGIGTQTIGLAKAGRNIAASDISEGALAEARSRAEGEGLEISFCQADFCALENAFSRKFDIIIAMDNALPHMLSRDSLEAAAKSIVGRLADGGMFVASIRDYDALLQSKPPYSPPYIHKTEKGQRVSFQTWDWSGNHYKLTQYIIDDGEELQIEKFPCEYRAFPRAELSEILLAQGCREVKWLLPTDCGFYQPIVIAKK